MNEPKTEFDKGREYEQKETVDFFKNLLLLDDDILVVNIMVYIEEHDDSFKLRV